MASLYLLCHVGLREVVKDESNLLLDILWRLYYPLCLVCGHQQGINVGGVDGGLKARTAELNSIHTGRSTFFQMAILRRDCPCSWTLL